MWLSEQQLRELTRRKQPAAQMRVLARAGIPFLAVDGRPVVAEDALRTREKRVKRIGRGSDGRFLR